MDSDNKLNFIFLGNLHLEKGLLVLLEASRALKTRNIPFHCDIVGAPTAEITASHINAKIIEYGLTDHVYLHGPRYGADKERLLQQADVMVFPTFYHNECFPLVLLEGMKHSLALISTAEGAIPDIIVDHETGILIEKQNAESLANAMEYLATNIDIARQFATAAHLRYMNHFTEGHFVERLCNILQGK